MTALRLVAVLCTAVTPSLSLRTTPGSTLLPSWKPDYLMNQSTFIEPCSSTTDYFNASFGAQYGIISYDWSGACPLPCRLSPPCIRTQLLSADAIIRRAGLRPLWEKAKPMNCSEVLVEQARLTKAHGTSVHVFVYENLVKVRTPSWLWHAILPRPPHVPTALPLAVRGRRFRG